eukprot:TRINITY_DN4981_c1_g1_i2.p1 TRINITY_DN4981_c1_g1~~TRINITY_DN4981_c1_g1_i2.p1  ORF type:complete len:206 (+),score=8.27 TRINITY_DN4981_c1_g1_i2:615-1232(+)
MCRKLYCQTFLIHSSTEHTNTLHLSTSESSITTRYFSTIVRKKINWDKGKELPSKFITHYINKCSASNMICLYHTPEGSLLSSVSEIEQTITTQFSSLYSPFQKSSFISFPPSMKRISAQALLQAPISHEEIKSVILQMKPLSALRPDTLPAALYQVCTPVVISLSTNTIPISRHVSIYRINHTPCTQKSQNHHMFRLHTSNPAM